MSVKSVVIFTILGIIAFIHISFVFQLLRAPSDVKVTTGVILIPLLLIYPIAFKYLNKF